MEQFLKDRRLNQYGFFDRSQPVEIKNLPNNYLKQKSNNVNTNEQLVRITRTEGGFLCFDSEQSKYNSNGFEIITDQLNEHLNRLRLVDMFLSTNVPNINSTNKRVIINYANLSGFPVTPPQTSTGSISFDLDEGYYNFNSTFLTMFEDKLNTEATLNGNVPSKWNFRTGPKLFEVLRASTDIHSPDYNKMKILTPFIVDDDYAFSFDASCPFIKYGKNLCHISPLQTINLNPSGQSINFFKSRMASMIYTRYLIIRSEKLTEGHHINSFNGKKNMSDLIAIVGIDRPSQSEYKILDTESDMVILCRSVEFKRLYITVTDEYDNVIPFGYDSQGNLLDNQIRMTFISHQ